jgi:hypothetical protein
MAFIRSSSGVRKETLAATTACMNVVCARDVNYERCLLAANKPRKCIIQISGGPFLN